MAGASMGGTVAEPLNEGNNDKREYCTNQQQTAEGLSHLDTPKPENSGAIRSPSEDNPAVSDSAANNKSESGEAEEHQHSLSSSCVPPPTGEKPLQVNASEAVLKEERDMPLL